MPEFGEEFSVPRNHNLQICCSRAYLTAESLRNHREKAKCQMQSNEPDLPDPLGDLSDVEAEDDTSFQQPIIITSVSLRQQNQDENDIDENVGTTLMDNSNNEDIDIFNEEPRAVIDDEDSISHDIRPNRTSFSRPNYIIEGGGENFKYEQRPRSPLPKNPLEFHDDTNESWVSADDEEDENGNEHEEQDGIELNDWDENELEDVEVYGDRDREEGVHERSSFEPNFINGSGSSRPVMRTNNSNDAKFKCNEPYCTYSTQVEKALRHHRENAHDPAGMHLCTLCVCRYKSKAELTRHIKIFHGHYGEIKCVPEILKVKENGKTVLKCSSCGYTNRSNHSLQTHVHSAHNPSGRFKCQLCVCQYSKQNQLTQHMAVTHKQKVRDENPAEMSPDDRQRKKFTYSKKKVIDDQTSTQVVSWIESDNNRETRFEKVVSNGDAYFKCIICVYRAATANSMVDHVLGAHVNKNPRFACPYCPCRYNNKEAYSIHLSSTHRDKPRPHIPSSTSDEEIAAPIPRKKVAGKSSVGVGVRTPRFSIPEPPMESYKLAIHNGQALFYCQSCGFKAKDMNATKAHIKTSHGPDARFNCKHCTARFATHSALGLHVARCHAEQIVMANEKYTQNANPNIDLVLADGQKIYRCKLCSYVSAVEHKCASHIEASHSDGQFGCKKCSCRFKTSFHLRTHMLNFHWTNEQSLDSAQTSGNTSVEYTDAESSFGVDEDLEEATNDEDQERPSLKYKCNKCPFSAVWRKSVALHLDIAHNPANPLKCPHCSCRFGKKNAISNHVKAYHKKAWAASSSPNFSQIRANVGKTNQVEQGKLAHKENSTNKSKNKTVKCDGFSRIISNGRTTLKCDKKGCSFTTIANTKMSLHLKKHGLKTEYLCNDCPRRFTTQAALSGHRKAHVREIKIAGTTSGPSEEPVDDFEGETIGAVLKCKISGCNFETTPQGESDLRNHILNEHSPTAPHKCKECPCRYNTEGDLSDHVAAVHNTGESGDDDDDDDEPNDNSSNEKSGFKCKFCKFSTGSKNSYVTHLMTSHAAKNQHSCSQCSCRFATAPGLVLHENKCHKKKSSKVSLKTHQPQAARRTHNLTRSIAKPLTWGKKHVCDQCSVEFNNPSSLKWHVVRVHSNRNPDQPTFPCNICGYNYDTENGLRLHKRKSHKIIPVNRSSATVDDLQNADDSDSSSKAGRKHTGSNDRADDVESEDEEDLFEEIIQSPKQPSSKRMSFKERSSQQCSKCVFVGDIEAHEKRAHVENGVQCKSCPCSFVSVHSLRSHENIVHNSRKQRKSNKSRSSGGYGHHVPVLNQKNESTVEEEQETAASVDASRPTLVPERIEKESELTATHICPLCSFKCSLALNLKAHMLNAHVKDGHACKFCVCSFRHEYGLNKHVKECHEDESTSPEDDSASSSSEKINDEDLDNMTERPKKRNSTSTKATVEAFSGQFRCDKDNCSFSSKADVNLMAHLKIAHKGDEHCCPQCKRQFRSEAILRSHMAIVHGESKGKGSGATGCNTSSRGPMSGAEEASNNDLFSCSKCSFTSSLRIHLKTHEKSHADDPESVQEKGPPGESSGTRKRQRDQSPDLRMNKKIQKISDSSPETEVLPKRKSAVRANQFLKSVISSEQATDKGGRNTRNGDDDSNDNNGPDNPPERKRARRQNGNNRTIQQNLTENELNETDENAANEPGETISNQIRARQSSREMRSSDHPAMPRTSQRENLQETDDIPVSSGRSVAVQEFKMLTCSRCAATFSSIIYLIKHFQECDQNVKTFSCNLCSNRFGTLLKLKEHLWKTHLVERDRARLSEGRPTVCSYLCSLCKLTLKDAKSFILHISVPHLFRCKKCSFVCGTKIAIDEHKTLSHPKQQLDINAPEDQPTTSRQASTTEELASDDIMIVFESKTTTDQHGVPNMSRKHTKRSSDVNGQSRLNSRSQKEQGPSTLAETVVDSQLDVVDNHGSTTEPNGNGVALSDANAGLEEPEPEVYDSLICEGCGYFSNTVEEAREHNKAIANIESLICFVCGYLATTPCDSILHTKSHQEENEEEEEAADDLNEYAVDMPVTVAVEFVEEQGDLEYETVEVPFVSDDQIPSDGVLLLDFPDLN